MPDNPRPHLPVILTSSLHVVTSEQAISSTEAHFYTTGGVPWCCFPSLFRALYEPTQTKHNILLHTGIYTSTYSIPASIQAHTPYRHLYQHTLYTSTYSIPAHTLYQHILHTSTYSLPEQRQIDSNHHPCKLSVNHMFLGRTLPDLTP